MVVTRMVVTHVRGCIRWLHAWWLHVMAWGGGGYTYGRYRGATVVTRMVVTHVQWGAGGYTHVHGGYTRACPLPRV